MSGKEIIRQLSHAEALAYMQEHGIVTSPDDFRGPIELATLHMSTGSTAIKGTQESQSHNTAVDSVAPAGETVDVPVRHSGW